MSKSIPGIYSQRWPIPHKITIVANGILNWLCNLKVSCNFAKFAHFQVDNEVKSNDFAQKRMF